MTQRSNVSAPTAVIHTNDSGSVAAGVATAPPQTGSDAGLQVYANLGSEVVAVSQELQGAANWATTQVALNSSTATSIFASRSTRRCALVTNTDAAITIYVGGSGVTASTGQPIAPGLSLTIPTTAAIYAIAASGTPTAAGSEAYD
jgi:hypothetical protein